MDALITGFLSFIPWTWEILNPPAVAVPLGIEVVIERPETSQDDLEGKEISEPLEILESKETETEIEIEIEEELPLSDGSFDVPLEEDVYFASAENVNTKNYMDYKDLFDSRWGRKTEETKSEKSSEVFLKKLDGTFSRDKYGVYYDHKPIKDARMYSFQPLNAFYSKDKENVFYQDFLVLGADGAKFEVLGWPHLARDKDFIYYRGIKQEDIDAPSFVLEGTYRAQDRSFWYVEKQKNLVAEEKYPAPLPTPEKVKGIYLHGYSFYRPEKRQEFVDLVLETELNALVIDIKSDDGRMLFVPENPSLKIIPQSRWAIERGEYQNILSDFQKKGIYTIARIPTFQDPMAAIHFPHLALQDKRGGNWKNNQGLLWMDMTHPQSWQVPVMQAKEAILLGFDEVQFDYIRFPSDGPIRQADYYDLPPEKKKYEVLAEFFEYIDQELGFLPHPLSIDLFGLTYRHYKNPEYALGIGQRVVDAAKHFDYLSPMIYPSHYGKDHFGLDSPIDQPYELIDHSMKEGEQLLSQDPSFKARSRPWLQDFTLHGVRYDAEKVRAQIDATEKYERGWLLWNARNVYTVEALKKEGEE